jgi:iron complex transport system substrate-binding protein
VNTSHRVRNAAVIIAVSFATLLAMVGCSSSAGEEGPGNTDVATGGKKFRTADAETARLGSDAKTGAFPRTVVHAAGTTEIPSEPQRVVVLDTGELDDVLSLGITPVGMATTDGQTDVFSYLQDKAEGIPTVGSINELNLEAIAALKPDLILGSTLRAENLYPHLSSIAPTVFSTRPGFPWKENFLLVADSLGKEDAATALLNQYQERADAVRRSIKGDPKISMVRFLPDTIRVYGNLSFIGVILDDVGLTRPELSDVDDLAVELSAETIDKADADWILYSSYGGADATEENSTTSGAIWQSMSAVKSDHAQPVDDEVWFLGLGPTGAMTVLDQLESILAR